MVTSSTSGSGLNQQAITNETGSTIVLFKPDDQQMITTPTTVTTQSIVQQQASIERPIEQTSQQMQTKQQQQSQTSSSMDTSPSFAAQKQDFKEEDLDINAKIAQQQKNQQIMQQQQRQHHNQQLNAAILANRNIDVLSAENENVLFKAASTGDTASIAQLIKHEGISLLTLGRFIFI